MRRVFFLRYTEVSVVYIFVLYWWRGLHLLPCNHDREHDTDRNKGRALQLDSSSCIRNSVNPALDDFCPSLVAIVGSVIVWSFTEQGTPGTGSER
jgi:hypothetical protein